MFCVKCGSQIADGAKFCPVCGNVIEMEPKSQAPVPEQPVNQGAAYQEPVYQQPVYQQPVQPQVQPVPQPAPEPEYRAEDDEATGFTPTQTKLLIRAMALLCYLGPYLFFPMFAFKEKKWLRHHVNNGLVLLIFGAGSAIIAVIPIVGWIIGGVVGVFCMVMMITGIIKSIKGQMYRMPWFFGKIKIVK